MAPKKARYLHVFESGLVVAMLFFMFVAFLAGVEAGLRGSIRYQLLKSEAIRDNATESADVLTGLIEAIRYQLMKGEAISGAVELPGRRGEIRYQLLKDEAIRDNATESADKLRLFLATVLSSDILFVNHPALTTITFGGFMLLQSLTFVRGRRPIKHMKTQLYSLAVAFLGIALVAIHKAKLGKPHLTTWHAQLGVLTMGLAVATTAVGSTMMLLWKLKVTVRPAFMRNGVLRRLHLRMAAVTQTAAGATILLGVQSNYFRNSMSLLVFGDTVLARLLVSLMSIFPTGAVLYYLWLRKQAAVKDE